MISVTINVERFKRIGVELYNHGDVTKMILDALFSQRSAVEAEIGSDFEWQRLDGKKATRIALFKTGGDPLDPTAWPRQHEWMLAQMYRFRRAFASRLKGVQVSELQGVAAGSGAGNEGET